VVFVKEEQIAQIVADAVNGLDEGEECEYGILCDKKDVRVKIDEDSSVPSMLVSASSCLHNKMKLALFIEMIILLFMNLYGFML